MASFNFSLFDTAIGRCAIAWGERGIICVQLPEADDTKTRGRTLRRAPNARETTPTADVQRAIDDIVALLNGEARDLGDVVLDMERVPSFERRVYEVARGIKPGQVVTYGEIAKRIGEPDAAQAVGQALGRNPFPIVVPCHRVVGAGDKLGGFSAPGGASTKRRMLAIERSPAAGTPDLFERM